MTSLKNYGLLVLNFLGLLGLLSILLAISYNHNARFDLTPSQVYTMSQHSLNILDGVQVPVKILAFVRKEDPRNTFLTDLFWRMQLRQPKISSRVVDINRNPSLARAYKADSYGSVIVECGPRRKVFNNVREEYLMAAILQVTRDVEKTVYVLSGHGEHDFVDSDRNQGYSTFRVVLQQEFYQVKPLTLFGDGQIPKDASVIIIPGPRRDIGGDELAKLEHYVRAGGALLIMIDPGTNPSLVAFLQRYKLDLPSQIIADGDFRLAASEPISARIPEKARESTITANLDTDPVFSLFGPIDFKAAPDEDVDIFPLLTTSKNSWAIPIKTNASIPDDLDFDGKRGDRHGPFVAGATVAVRLTEPQPEVKADESVKKAGRMIVYGDSDFANNQFIDLLGNRDLLVNSVNWLAVEDALIGVRSDRKQMGKEQFFVSSRQNQAVLTLGVIVLPSAFLVLGLAVFVRRRMS
jgi:hypothetical protein